MSLARRYLPPQCVSHTQNPPHKQKAGSSWIAGAIGACCVSARAARRVSAPVAMAAANGARPAASVRLFCVRLDRGVTTCLHLAAWVALFAHASVLLAWLAPTPAGPPHRLTFRAGSIERTTRSMSRRGRFARPRGTSAAMAMPTASAAPRRLAFGAVAGLLAAASFHRLHF